MNCSCCIHTGLVTLTISVPLRIFSGWAFLAMVLPTTSFQIGQTPYSSKRELRSRRLSDWLSTALRRSTCESFFAILTVVWKVTDVEMGRYNARFVPQKFQQTTKLREK